VKFLLAAAFLLASCSEHECPPPQVVYVHTPAKTQRSVVRTATVGKGGGVTVQYISTRQIQNDSSCARCRINE
jgi:uncharacterized lipoprotein YajG